MVEPTLMPYQQCPFNGDTFIEAEFLKLKERFGVSTVIETGTCLGYTTLWLAKNFEKVYTIELNKEYCELARAKFLQYPNITSIHGNSEDVLRHLRIDGNAMFFLDAHWGNNCPLLGELHAIQRMGIKPVIAIHDFLVPDYGEVLGYDQFKGQPFKIGWIKSILDQIYMNGTMVMGKPMYEFYYNSLEKSTGARRGIIYIYPA